MGRFTKLPQAIPILMLLTAFSVGCSEINDVDGALPENKNVVSAVLRTENDASQIASAFWGRSRAIQTDYSVEYVTTKAYSRSTEMKDTVAYIFNNKSGDGFVMVSAKTCLPPVLAFSNTNNLNYEETEDDPVYSLFVESLDLSKYKNYWFGAGTSGYDFKPEYGLFDQMIELCPDTVWHWNQWEFPYRKYVETEHPGCPYGYQTKETWS